MSEILTGSSGQQYTITDHIKSGGEGGVYNTNLPECVAKLYDISKTSIDARMAELEQKLKYMVSYNIPTKIPNGTVIVTWPQDVLYRNGKFVGYIMPKVSGAKPIYMLNRGGKYANEVIPGYNWKTAVSVAVNLVNIVEFLHSRNVVVGDMNSDNLLVYPNGFVAVIDTDSFDITDEASNIHYKCSVGTEEFLPPELQGRNLERKNVCFTKHTDEFALAVHIFQLLMNNMHPFNARVIIDYKQSLPVNDRNHNIVVGNCPFVRKIDGCVIPLGAPDINALLPDYIVQDFKRTFDYQLDQSDPSYMEKLKRYEENRTPATDWHKHLVQLANDQDLVKCQNNPEHYYLAYKGHCELCEAKSRLLIGRGAGVTAGGGAGVTAGGGTGVTVGGGTGGGFIQKPKKTKLAVIGSVALIAVFIMAYVYYSNSPMKAYKTAMSDYDKGYYEIAASEFEALGYYKDSHEMWQKSNYEIAMSDYDEGYYEIAVSEFEDLGDYEDSYKMWLESMASYIDTHYDNSDTTTYGYLETLDGLGYDLEDVYHELYDWRVERAFVNTDSSDTETKLDSISRSETWYAHFLIEGGRPGEELNAYVKKKSAGDSFYNDDYKKDYSLSDGEYLTCGDFYYETPSIGKTGTWVMDLFDAETDELLGSATVKIIK